MRNVILRNATIVVSLASTACGGAASVDPVNTPTPILTHPSGSVVARALGLTGRPFGVRVSSLDVVYATEQDANDVASFTLGTLTPGSPVAVGADPGDVVFAADGLTAYVSAFNAGTVHVIDVATSRQVASIPVSTNAYRMTLSADGTRLFVSSTNGRIYVIRTADRTVAQNVQLTGSIQGLALSRSGQFLIATSIGGRVWKLDASSLAILASATLNGPAQDVALSPDDTKAYVALEAGSVVAYNTGTLVETARVALTPAQQAFGLAMTPDGAQLYVTSPGTGSAAVIDVASLVVLRSLALGGEPRRVAFNKSGSVAVIANEGNWVDVIR